MKLGEILPKLSKKNKVYFFMRHGDAMWNRCLRILGPSFNVRCERTLSDQLSLLSPALAPQPPALRSAPDQAFSTMSAHSAPVPIGAHPIFCPLRSVFRSAHILCLVRVAVAPLRTLPAGFVTGVHFSETHNCDQITTRGRISRRKDFTAN